MIEFEENIIYIDSRETKSRRYNFIKSIENNLEYLNHSKHKGLKPIYEKIKNGEKWYEIANLEYGDYIYNNIIFEYKTEDDFISSSRTEGKGSTRLNRQLYECNRFASQDIVYTVIEGDINNIQSEFLSRMSVKTGLIINPYQWKCFKLMLYIMRLGDKITYPPTNNIKDLTFGVSMALTLGFSIKQANTLDRNCILDNVDDFIQVFNQDLDSFKKETNVKMLKEKQFNRAKRWLGL